MVRKRRRTKYTWLPTLGGLAQNGDDQYPTSYFGGQIIVNSSAQGPTDLYVTPIVPDQTEFVDQALNDPGGPTLRDFTEGQDWLCKRVVGKLSVGAIQINAVDTPPYIIVGAGLFVSRADDANENIPDTNNAEIDPLGSRNVRQPWMWRRTFILTNASSGFVATPALMWTHLDNGSFGTMCDGQMVDAKMARRIRREERLWLVVNAYGLSELRDSGSPPWGTPGSVEFLFDYRVLGAMRRSNNRSTF